MKPLTVSIVSIVIALIFLGGVIVLSLPTAPTKQVTQNNAATIDGKQVVEINAKGGYSPRTNVAKADTPTIIKVKTAGTFDCSAALTIPSIGYQTFLPPSGETLIEIPPQKKGTTLQGVCSMGMYNFSISFS